MIGFIGAGNMATAIIKGMISNGIKPADVFLYDIHEEKMRIMKEMGINICSSGIEVVESSKYIYLAVKPHIYDPVLKQITAVLNENSVVITMAAGYEIKKVKDIIGNKKVVRTMPNTPALVGEGFTAVCFDDLITSQEKSEVFDMLKTFGTCHEITENYINAYSAISGSGPAYLFMIMEAMADAAVLLGIPRADAYRVVESTIMGSAKLAKDTGMHPGQLKDMVCSPGGTTIEGVRTLEERGLRSSLIECIVNTYKKNLEITKIR